MKPACLIILTPTTASLDFQFDILSRQSSWINDFRITFGYYIPVYAFDFEMSGDEQLATNQYTYLDLVDKAFSYNHEVDMAKLYATKVLLIGSKSKTFMVNGKQALQKHFDGCDLILMQHCNNETDNLCNHFIKAGVHHQSPFYLTSGFSNQPVHDVYFIYNGSEQNTQSLKYFTYLFDKKLLQYHLQLITIVNEQTIENERIVVDYVKGKFHRISVERVYEDEANNWYKKLLTSGSNHTLISDRGNTSLIAQYHQLKSHSTSNLSNLFISG